MPDSRRKFLRNFGLGVLGSAAVLLPSKASASFLRRRGGACSPEMVPVAPVYLLKPSYGPISPCYPTATSGTVTTPIIVNVTKAGNWFSWGTNTIDTGGPVTFKVLDASKTEVPALLPKPIPLPNDDPNLNWAFSYKGMPAGMTFYLQPYANGLQFGDAWGPYLAQ